MLAAIMRYNEIETQQHVLEACPGYTNLKVKHDMDTVDGRMEFFRSVLKVKEEMKAMKVMS